MCQPLFVNTTLFPNDEGRGASLFQFYSLMLKWNIL